MKKILIVSTVSRQFYLFERGNIEVLNSMGYQVHTAANFTDSNERLDELDIIRHPIDIQRSPFSFKNIKAYQQLKKLMKKERFDAVHCHSPMGGVLARLAAKTTNTKPVIYTAHGFHFYKGASIINNLIYKNIEKCMARYTDRLITINKEDYAVASGFRLRENGTLFYVPGIGLDINKISSTTVDFENKRAELGIPRDVCVILSVGELIKRKNYKTAIKSFARADNKGLLYVICGKGKLDVSLKKLVDNLHISDKVIFAGFRKDICEIVKIADIFLFPSFQEGLPVSVMEAMSAGIPCIVSKIRGNVDLIDDEIGGYIFEPSDINGFTGAINKLSNNKWLRVSFGNYNIDKVQAYSIEKVKEKMKIVYGGGQKVCE